MADVASATVKDWMLTLASQGFGEWRQLRRFNGLVCASDGHILYAEQSDVECEAVTGASVKVIRGLLEPSADTEFSLEDLKAVTARLSACEKCVNTGRVACTTCKGERVYDCECAKCNTSHEVECDCDEQGMEACSACRDIRGLAFSNGYVFDARLLNRVVRHLSGKAMYGFGNDTLVIKGDGWQCVAMRVRCAAKDALEVFAPTTE